MHQLISIASSFLTHRTGVKVLWQVFWNICVFTFVTLLGAFMIMLVIILAAAAIGFHAAIGARDLSGRIFRLGFFWIAKPGKLLWRNLSLTSIWIKNAFPKLWSREKR